MRLCCRRAHCLLSALTASFPKVAVFGAQIHQLKAASQKSMCGLNWKSLKFTMFEGGIQTENKVRSKAKQTPPAC